MKDLNSRLLKLMPLFNYTHIYVYIYINNYSLFIMKNLLHLFKIILKYCIMIILIDYK
jgi:hypothetical protein